MINRREDFATKMGKIFLLGKGEKLALVSKNGFLGPHDVASVQGVREVSTFKKTVICVH